MNEPYTLITFASWEDRFREGVAKLLADANHSQVLMYYFDRYADKSSKNRKSLKTSCEDRHIPLTVNEFRVNEPAMNWRCLRDSFAEHIRPKSRTLVDISTMPREVIWTVFWFLDLHQCRVEYVYHLPKSYGDWLSRDPQRPRLVYKMSGLTKLGKRTVLVVLAGYDADRTQQLINFYEPELTLLGLQAQSKDRFNSEKMQSYIHRFEKESSVEIFEVDAFGADHGQAVVTSRIQSLLKDHNVIMSSLGPKLSAIALYRIHRANRETALTYLSFRTSGVEYLRI